MSRVRFWKTQTIGNDFVLFQSDDLGDHESRLSMIARFVCDRRFSIGSDGMLTVGVRDSVLQMRMFNPDGTEDFCGNGLRCAAVHARNQGWVGDSFVIEHFGRLVEAEVCADGTARTAIGPAVYDAEVVPLNTSLHPEPLIEETVCGFLGSALNAGTTHFVTFVEEIPGDDEFNRVGPTIEHHDLFPERTSVIFAKRTGTSALEIRIWERGVGETLGCGTGSSAAAAELMRRDHRAMTVDVHNPGGVLKVSTDVLGGSLVTASKPVTVFTGTIELPL